MEQGITPYGVISRLSEQGNKNLLPLSPQTFFIHRYTVDLDTL